jgi:predicted ATPase
MIGAYNVLAGTLQYLGDFDSARQYVMRGVQIWRSGSVPSHAGELESHAVVCLCFAALFEWHFGEIASYQATMAEAISLAKELNETNALAVALYFAAFLGNYERNPAEVERVASDLIELSTLQSFSHWLALGSILRGWARSVLGDTTEGISWIEDGIEDYRGTGSMIDLPYLLSLKAEALYLADRTPEAIQTIREAEAPVERFDARWWSAELHRLRGVFLTAMGAEEMRIEASFCAAIRTAREQKSVSLEKRAEGTYTEYRRQKASGSGVRGFRLPLC